MNMQMHIGTKLVKLQPMNRQEYNDYRGWQLPADEDGADEGYLVESSSEKPNDQRHEGYISWSPKAQAEAAYRPTDGISFGLAIEAMKKGMRVSRAGWNGSGQWTVLITGPAASRAGRLDLEQRLMLIVGSDTAARNGCGFDEYLNEPIFADAIYLKNTRDELVPWTPSQGDQLADDWMIL